MSALFVVRWAAVVACGVAISLPASLRGEEHLRESTSLRWVPSDAAFYGALLRNREQFEAVANSNAARSIKETPIVAMGLAMLRAQWDNPEDENLRRLKAWYEDPQNQNLVQLAREALSQEVFVYGGHSFADMIEFSTRINRFNTQAQLEAIRAGKPLDDEQAADLAKAMVKFLLDNPDKLQAPDVVVGFKINDTDRALEQLARLEKVARAQLENYPHLAERLTRAKVAGGEFLVWRLDGSLIPWEKVKQQNKGQPELDAETLQKLIDLIKTKELTVSVGVREGYLLISVGDTNQHLEKLGQAPLLVEREDLAPLRKFADKPLTSVGYVSQEFRERMIASRKQQVEGMFSVFETMVRNPGAVGPNTIDLDDETRRELADDLQKLGEQISSAIPEQGAALGFSFMTPQGYEGYAYDWAERPLLDASRPLTILDHLGGSPLAFVAGRRKYAPERYEKVVHWIKRAFYYFEKVGLKQLEAENRGAYEDFRRQAVPLLARLDLTNRELLLPAFRDGQRALVLDAKSQGKTWHAQMPPPQSPLPMLELALVYGVSDAAALRQAVTEYFLVAREVWEKAQTAAAEARQKAEDEGKQPDGPELPDIDVVQPAQREIDTGRLYYFPLPQAWGLDQRFAPNAALSEDFLVFSLLPEFSERLLKEKPLQGVELPAKSDRPLAAASYLNFAGLLDAVGPWINYAIDVQAKRQAAQAEDASQDDDPNAEPDEDSNDQETPPAPETEALKQQVRFVLDVLKCYRGFSSVTYREDDALVTHYQSRYQDLPK